MGVVDEDYVDVGVGVEELVCYGYYWGDVDFVGEE